MARIMMKAQMDTGMAIFAPGGKLGLAACVTREYFCENTWSVMRVRPATVAVDAGTYVVCGTE
jgi:hypothetical protein